MKRHPVVVIKLGTSSIVHEETHKPLLSTLAIIAETAAALRKNGYKVVIVSSGAIGVSLWKMNLARRPKHLPQVQALAAIGQCRLLGIWEKLFDQLDQPIAQILLTRNDIADRTQYLNAQNTFNELLNMGVIPIVNENDTLSVAEIKFGDNDTLSAITAGMIQADYLFLMTDVDCLYDKNPRTYADAKAIEVVENISELSADVSSAGSALGTGGMSTKIVAARLATAAGVTTIITRSSKPGQIAGILDYIEGHKAMQRKTLDQAPSPMTSDGVTSAKSTPTPTSPESAPLHTRFLPSLKPIRDRHFWLLHGLKPHGAIYIDAGAASALRDNAGLLPAGVLDAVGSFAQQECVRIIQVDIGSASRSRSANSAEGQSVRPGMPRNSSSRNLSESTMAAGREIGRAIVNYSCIEVRRIAGCKSTDIATILGYADSEYVALRENIALLTKKAGAFASGSTHDNSVGGGEKSTILMNEEHQEHTHSGDQQEQEQ